MRKYNPILLALVAVLLAVKPVQAQTLQPNYGAPVTPVSVCNGNTSFSIKIIGSAPSCTTGTLNITLPAGYVYVSGSAALSAGHGSLSQSSASNNLATLNLSAIPDAPDSMVISFQGYATCSAIGSSNNQVGYTLNTSCLPPNTVTSNTFNTQSAALNITSITNKSYSGAAGDVYTRAITIANNGLGNISQINLADTSGNGLYIYGITVSSGWSLGISKSISGTDTINMLTLSGPSLSQGQSIVVTETVKLVSRCYLQSRLNAYFGCSGNACTANNVNSTATAGATISTPFTPSIKVLPTVSALLCRGSAYTQTIGFIDTGAVSINGLSINFFNYNGVSNGYANFRYKYGANGTWNTLPLDSSRLNGPALPCITGMPDTAWATIPVIHPGDTVFVAFEEQDCPLTAVSSTILIAGLGLSYNYGDACGDSTNVITSFPRTYQRTQMGVLSTLPANMLPGTPYKFVYDFSLANSTTYTISTPGGSRVHFLVVLPNNVDFSGSISDITLTNISTGLPLATPAGYSYNIGTHTIDFTYTVGGGFTVNAMQNCNLTINNLTLNCAATSNGNTVQMNCFMKSSLSCSTEEQLLQQSNALAFICPVSCGTIGGLSFNDFTVRRTNYGLPDNDNNGVPDASGSLDMTKVRTTYTLPGDTLEVGFYGVVSTGSGTPAGGFKYGLAADTLSASANKLTNLYATIQLFAAGSSTPFYTYNNLPISGGTGTTRKVNFSISTLNALSPLPGGHTTFNNGDSIVLKMYYKAVNNTSSLVAPVSLSNKFYVSNVSAPTAAQMYSCGGNYIGNCTLISYSPNSHGSGAYTLNGGGTIAITIDNYLTVGTAIAGSKPFVNEYRPISIYDSLSYTIPSGYSFVSATAAYSYTKGISSSTTKTVPITPVVAGSNPLIFDIGSLFTSGTFPLGDQGSSIVVTINVSADCYPPALSNNLFYFRQVATPGYNTSFPGYAINSTTGTITFVQPTLTPTTAATVSSGTDSVSWDIQLDVSSTTPANNVWMAKDAGPSGITILNVQQISAIGGTVLSTITPTGGGIFQLGAFSQATSYYRVNGIFSSCTKDSLQLAYGLVCNTGTYPSSIATATSLNDLELFVNAQQPSLQLSITTQPGSAKNFCDTIPYELEISNGGLGSALGLNVVATLPAPGNIYYIPNTFKFQFPAGSGTYISIPDAQVAISGNNIIFTIPASVLKQLNSSERYRIQFGLNTSCGFVSGSSVFFSPNGTAYCGQAANGNSQQGQQIQIIGAPSAYNAYTLKSKAYTLSRDCDSTGDVLVPYHFKIINQGPLATGSADGFSIQLQAPWQLDTNSVTYPHDPAGASFSYVSGNTWYFRTGVGVSVGDSVQMYCMLRVPAAQVASLVSGSNSPINENAVVQYVGFCSASGQPCPVSQVVLASKNTATIFYSNSHSYYTNPPVLAVTNPAAVCVPHTIDLTAAAVTAGSTAGLGYSYYMDAGATTPLANPSTVSTAATYYVVGTGKVTGCGTDTLGVTTSFNAKPTLVTSADTIVCKDGVATLGASSPGSTIQWTGLPAGDTVTVTPPESIYYQAIATSAAGCKDTAVVNVQIEAIAGYLNASPNITIQGKTVVLTTTNSYQVVAWLPVPKFSNQTGSTQSIVMGDSSETFGVVLKSIHGCLDTATVQVIIDPTSSTIFVPNAFTPNGDGKNDVFTVVGPAIKDLELRVFNQWGQQIFATQDKTRPWTGLYNGEPQPAGVYIYVVKVTLFDGSVISKKGTVLLIR